MNRSKYIYIAFIGAMVMLLFFGCASMLTGYGKLRPQPMRGEGVAIEDLEQNWEDYVIHYAGQSVGTPAAIMFDPKDDDRTLVGDRWTKVEDQKTLSELIGWIKAYQRFYPRVWRILGPDDHLYGYLYFPLYRAVFKVVDSKTMYAFDVPSPNHLSELSERRKRNE
jgi:hypothetical protein